MGVKGPDPSDHFKKMKKLILNLVVLFCTPIFTAHAVSLVWDHNPDNNVTGYVLYASAYDVNQDTVFTDSKDTLAANGTNYPTETGKGYVFSVCAYYGTPADKVESDFSNKCFFFPTSVSIQEAMSLDAPFDWHNLQTGFYDAAQWMFVRQHLSADNGVISVSVELSHDGVSWVTLFSVPRSGQVVPMAFYKLVFP